MDPKGLATVLFMFIVLGVGFVFYYAFWKLPKAAIDSLCKLSWLEFYSDKELELAQKVLSGEISEQEYISSLKWIETNRSNKMKEYDHV